ncbi:MAG TPA: gluconate 2-dehydrogenase subunit 3 family protein [Gemmatimonadaceae bacterium]|nr:gluconate 2-dehydrogenase subunit 3 family protein [Gemmatimonadaceae bacterium]
MMGRAAWGGGRGDLPEAQADEGQRVDSLPDEPRPDEQVPAEPPSNEARAAEDSRSVAGVSSDGDATVTRRDALKAFGAAPLLATLGVSVGQLERALRGMERAAAPSPAHEAAPAAPKFFNAHEWRTLGLLVDYIIPRDARSGSATDAKVPEFIDFLMSDPDASAASKTAMRGGLAWIDAECRSRFGSNFADSKDTQRRQVLDDIAWPKKARPEMSQGAAFFRRLRDLTASGFFSSAMGWKDVQYEGNVFNPHWNGCPPAAVKKLGVSY